ncbi:Protein of unknown function (DUF432) [Cyclonatronum proteinivorum]|uniref:DUF432 domain-containing protein n=1 Tax=Cyclonatronum proteinivorum TaxID=1457365 RepID=A0A345UIQ8_9BACT|nr:DUF432 domain-containing protein [Cyclonatronum proteinivorum]AXJ00360.1 Protein of unknown function (DUF432) [Cyclonatronum proteinivorum]
MIWGDYSLEDGVRKSVCLDDLLNIHLKGNGSELWLAYDRNRELPPDINDEDDADHDGGADDDEGQASSDDTDHDVHTIDENQWTRWRLRSAKPVISLSPAFPNLPFVVHPEHNYQLAPGAETRLFMRIPVAVTVADKTDNNLRLTEINAVELVKTWFGTFESGEVCYWVKTVASLKVRPEMVRAHRCYCPVLIRNESDDFLHIEKICLRVERLSIFEKNGMLWSDQMRVVHKGGDNFSDLTVDGRPPAEAEGATLLTRPRNPVREGIALRTFKALNQLPVINMF